jgi:hypothetical protein
LFSQEIRFFASWWNRNRRNTAISLNWKLIRLIRLSCNSVQPCNRRS